jgi:predicted nucleotidyltransferase
LPCCRPPKVRERIKSKRGFILKRGVKLEKQGGWEEAVNLFLTEWKKKKEVMGALVCGSYVTGSPSEHSDIDLHIVLSNKTKWRERGNKFVNGFLIEYFANPPKQIKKYFDGDYKDNSYQAPIMFITGKILFDKEGEVAKLKRIAQGIKNKKFPKLSKVPFELKKYSLWDNLDNLQDNYKKGRDDFYYIYYNYLKQIYETYAKYKRVSVINVDKLYSIFTDASTLRKYLEKEFPDKRFVSLFLKALKLTSKDIMLKNFEELSEYVFDSMEGFKINGWKIRSPIDK